MTVSPSVASAAAKGRVLIVGATGFIGQFIAEASLAAGKPTYLLVRSLDVSPSKAKSVKTLQDKGAIIVHGAVKDQESVEKILKEHEIDIVISAVGGEDLLDQLTLVHAIKAVGTIKRFLPSEFGHDVDRADPVEPGLSMYKTKRRVRRLTEESELPYTYICCNSIASWPYCDNTHPSQVLPPLDEFQIYGDGSVKGRRHGPPHGLLQPLSPMAAIFSNVGSCQRSVYEAIAQCIEDLPTFDHDAYFVAGSDIGKFTIKAADDVRTINKSVHFRPSCNFLNINELASLWEKKIGRILPRVAVTEDDLLAAAKENIIPQSVVASFTHDIFIKGCQINFSIDGPHEVEVSDLYPEESFRTVDECFDDFVEKLDENQRVGSTDDAITTQNRVVEMLPITAMCG